MSDIMKPSKGGDDVDEEKIISLVTAVINLAAAIIMLYKAK